MKKTHRLRLSDAEIKIIKIALWNLFRWVDSGVQTELIGYEGEQWEILSKTMKRFFDWGRTQKGSVRDYYARPRRQR